MNGPSDFHDWEYERLSDSDKDEDEDYEEDDEPDCLDYDYPTNYGGKPL
ncbi:MAG: hypothetical protein P9F75_00680 [Candidatus Contendobacter sp.]|nr:hypothetical protein [Candidatus Contendobacter sp.]